MISPSDGVRQLADFSQQLEQAIQNRSLQDIFAKSIDSKTVFEPKERRFFAQIKQFLNRLISPKKYDLETNLRQFQKYFDEASKVNPQEFGAIQKTYTADLEEMVNTFADRLETIRDHAKEQTHSAKKIAALQAIIFKRVDIEERAAETLQGMLDKAEVDTQSSPDAVFDAKMKELPEGVRLKEPEALRQAFIQKFETRRISLFVDKLDAKIKDLEERMPTLDLDAALQEFTRFTEQNMPPGVSREELREELKEHSGPRLKSLEKTIGLEKLKRRAGTAIADAKKDIPQNADQKLLAGHFEVFSILRNAIVTYLPEPEKTTYLNEIALCENQILQQQTPKKTYTVTDASGPFQAGDGNTLNVTYIQGTPPDETIRKIQQVGSSVLRDSLIRTAAYIAMEAILKGPSSILSSSFLLSLAAPYLAIYATNKLCAQLPSSVSSYAKPFIATFTTLALVRCAVPLVDRSIRDIIGGGIAPSIPLIPTPLPEFKPSGFGPPFIQGFQSGVDSTNVSFTNLTQAVLHGVDAALERQQVEPAIQEIPQPELLDVANVTQAANATVEDTVQPIQEPQTPLQIEPFVANATEARIADGLPQWQIGEPVADVGVSNVTQIEVQANLTNQSAAPSDIAEAVPESGWFDGLWKRVGYVWEGYQMAAQTASQQVKQQGGLDIPVPKTASSVDKTVDITQISQSEQRRRT